jgi:serine/threonine protein phosphatase PrpC
MAGAGLDFQWAQHSDVGMHRRKNEDAVLGIPSAGVFCVADGMGGTAAGEVASRMLVESVGRAFDGLWGSRLFGSERKSTMTKRAIVSANRDILDYAREHGHRMCGTTIVALILGSRRYPQARVLHAGDSRAYRLRAGRLQRLTRDHSFAAAAGVEDERLLPERYQSMITRAVGVAPRALVEETIVDVAAHDLFLLCSDGLNRMVADERIEALLKRDRAENIEHTAEALVQEANKAGGADNTTVVVVRLLPAGA